MASIQDFKIHRQRIELTMTCRAHKVTGKVYDDDGQMVADYTGNNALHWPRVLNQITELQRDWLINELSQNLMLMVSGELEVNQKAIPEESESPVVLDSGGKVKPNKK